jgi:diguanylate cyclase (GGDEF)-like protein
MSSISLHNWNYDATGLLSKVEQIINRDKHLFGQVVQRSVSQRLTTGAEHVITFIEVLPPKIHLTPEDMDYGNIRLVQEIYDLRELTARLQGLQELRFAVGLDTFRFEAQFGFSDQYEASNNDYGEWPGTVFNVAARYSILPTGPLWHSQLPSHDSVYAAIREFLKLTKFHDFSDARLGHILIYFPNFNGRLARLNLNGLDLTISVAGGTRHEDIIFEVLYSNGKRKQRCKRRFSGMTENVALDFQPLELHVLLFSQSGELLDFHDETLMYSRGCNPVLPKQEAISASIAHGDDGIPELFRFVDNGGSNIHSAKQIDVNILSLKMLPDKEQFLRDVQAHLEQSCVMTILVVDLDNFKLVNDTNGHLAGDTCLESVVSIIAAIISRKGQLYRWGGDEFAVVLINFDITEAQATAERIRMSVEASGAGGEIKVTTSIGAAAVDRARTYSAEQLLGAADKAMYASKKGGKNRVTVAPVNESESHSAQQTTS